MISDDLRQGHGGKGGRFNTEYVAGKAKDSPAGVVGESDFLVRPAPLRANRDRLGPVGDAGRQVLAVDVQHPTAACRRDVDPVRRWLQTEQVVAAALLARFDPRSLQLGPLAGIGVNDAARGLERNDAGHAKLDAFLHEPRGPISLRHRTRHNERRRRGQNLDAPNRQFDLALRGTDHFRGDARPAPIEELDTIPHLRPQHVQQMMRLGALQNIHAHIHGEIRRIESIESYHDTIPSRARVEAFHIVNARQPDVLVGW